MLGGGGREKQEEKAAGWSVESLDVIVMDSQFCRPQDGKID